MQLTLVRPDSVIPSLSSRRMEGFNRLREKYSDKMSWWNSTVFCQLRPWAGSILKTCILYFFYIISLFNTVFPAYDWSDAKDGRDENALQPSSIYTTHCFANDIEGANSPFLQRVSRGTSSWAMVTNYPKNLLIGYCRSLRIDFILIMDERPRWTEKMTAKVPGCWQ